MFLCLAVLFVCRCQLGSFTLFVFLFSSCEVKLTLFIYFLQLEAMSCQRSSVLSPVKVHMILHVDGLSLNMISKYNHICTIYQQKKLMHCSHYYVSFKRQNTCRVLVEEAESILFGYQQQICRSISTLQEKSVLHGWFRIMCLLMHFNLNNVHSNFINVCKY